MTTTTDTDPDAVIRALRADLAAAKRAIEIQRQDYDALLTRYRNVCGVNGATGRRVNDLKRLIERVRTELLELQSGDGVLGDLNEITADDVPAELDDTDRELVLRAIQILGGEQ